MTFVNYQQIEDDLVSLINDSAIEFNYVASNMDDYERSITNAPYCNVALSRAENEITAGNVYTNRAIIEIEIATLDLSSKREAVTIRNGLVNEVQDLIRNNTQFSANLESIVLNGVDFAVFGSFDEDEDQSFTATALVTCEAIIYSQ